MPLRGRRPVIHLAVEYLPYARTGGLGEAVHGLATYERKAGRNVAVVMPLHRVAREALPALVPVGDPVEVPIGAGREAVRLLRHADGADDPPVYFVEHPAAFDRAGLYGEEGRDYPDNALRFALFARAALAFLPRIARHPPILHAHDWHTALAPLYLRRVLAGDPWFDATRSIISVHNPGYQGHFPSALVPALGLPWEVFTWRELEWYGQVNFLKGGLAHCDLAVTVSPTQAAELRTPEGGFGLHEQFRHMGPRLVGILNGIDQRVWDPRHDPHIPSHFTPERLEGKARNKRAVQRWAGFPEEPDIPLLAFTSRLAAQKGLDLILQSPQLAGWNVQAIFAGAGDARYAEGLRAFARVAPERFRVFVGFDDALEHRVLAGADVLLMPSQYEPCGLTQMRSQRYGCLPVARRVGGLADTIEDGVTGFLFDAFTPEAFLGALARALAVYGHDRRLWRAMQRAAMRRDFGWERSALAYREVYDRLEEADAPA